jgi:hypothetical protein
MKGKNMARLNKAARKASKGKATARKPRMSATQRTALAGVAIAAFAAGVSEVDLIARVRAAGGNQQSVRDEVIVGRIASGTRSLGSNLPDEQLIADGRAILAMAGATASRLADGQSRRSPVQEKLYNAARQYWHQLLKRGELVSSDPRAGNSNAKGRKTSKTAKRAKAANSNKPVNPVVRTPAKAIEHVTLQAAALLAFSNKNAKHLPQSFGQAIVGFHTAIMEAGKQFA